MNGPFIGAIYNSDDDNSNDDYDTDASNNDVDIITMMIISIMILICGKHYRSKPGRGVVQASTLRTTPQVVCSSFRLGTFTNCSAYFNHNNDNTMTQTTIYCCRLLV